MRKYRWLFIGLASLLLVGAGALWAWGAAPRVAAVFPADGAASVPPAAPLRITFSRPMQPASVQSRLSFTPPAPGAFSWDGNTLQFTPDQPWPGGITVTVQLAGGAQAQDFPRLPLLGAQNWSFTTATPLLAYLWPADGPADLYALDPLSGRIEQWTDNGAVIDFRVSFDGATIFFTAQNSAGGNDIFRLDRLSGATERVVDCADKRCAAPRPSPAGDALVYERYDKSGVNLLSPQLWLMPLPPGEASLLTPLSSPATAAWSQQGRLAYFNAYSSAYVILDPQTGEETSFPNRTGWPGGWSPDGETFVAPEIVIAFSSNELSLQASELHAFSLARSTTRTLVPQNFEENSAPAFSPDGQWLAFTRKTINPTHFSADQQIWRARPDGSEPRPLTDAPLFTHYDLAWSPDGRQIAFVRADQNQLKAPLELWLMNADGSEALLLLYAGFAPQWIP